MIKIFFEDRKTFKNKFGEDLLNRYLSIRDKITDPEWKDMDLIASHKTKEELEDYIDNFKSNTQRKREEKIDGAKLLWTACGFKCYEVTSQKAMQQLGRNTTWCIAGNYKGHESEGLYWFNRYIRDNDLLCYYVLIGHGDKFCILKGGQTTLEDKYNPDIDELYNSDQSIKDKDAMNLILSYDDENGTLREKLCVSLKYQFIEAFGVGNLRRLKLALKMIGEDINDIDYKKYLSMSEDEFLKFLDDITYNNCEIIASVGDYDVRKCETEQQFDLLKTNSSWYWPKVEDELAMVVTDSNCDLSYVFSYISKHKCWLIFDKHGKLPFADYKNIPLPVLKAVFIAYEKEGLKPLFDIKMIASIIRSSNLINIYNARKGIFPIKQYDSLAEHILSQFAKDEIAQFMTDLASSKKLFNYFYDKVTSEENQDKISKMKKNNPYWALDVLLEGFSMDDILDEFENCTKFQQYFNKTIEKEFPSGSKEYLDWIHDYVNIEKAQSLFDWI